MEQLLVEYNDLKSRMQMIQNKIIAHPLQLVNRLNKGNQILSKVNEGDLKLDLRDYPLIDYNFDFYQDPNTDWRPTTSYKSTFIFNDFSVICVYIDMDADSSGNYKIINKGQVIDIFDDTYASTIQEKEYPEINFNIIRLINIHANNPYSFMDGEYKNPSF